MLIREIEAFRDQVAIPRMQQLLSNVHIPDGMCCINHLEISFCDGRSWGTDSEIKASGLIYRDGIVTEYSYDECDISVEEFASEHANCIFISDGKLIVWHELEETEITSLIRNIGFCARLFPELSQGATLHMESDLLEYVKMQHIYRSQQEGKQPLSEQIKSADIRAESNQTQEEPSSSSKLCYGSENQDERDPF